MPYRELVEDLSTRPRSEERKGGKGTARVEKTLSGASETLGGLSYLLSLV